MLEMLQQYHAGGKQGTEQVLNMSNLSSLIIASSFGLHPSSSLVN